MKILRKIINFLFVISFITTMSIVIMYIYVASLPKIDINNINNLTIYDNKKNIIFSGNGNKEWISLEKISPYLIDATISTEDKRFYNHTGFDFLRILKSIYVNISTKNLSEGASTITQQLARNLFSNFDKTWQRKLKEAWYAFRLEINYSKDEILEAYLNTINYGHGIYGIENASKFYFNKKAKDLTLAEAAILINIPKSPNNYSPINNYNKAKERQKYVLKIMLNNQIITEDEYNKAILEELNIYGKKENINLNQTINDCIGNSQQKKRQKKQTIIAKSFIKKSVQYTRNPLLYYNFKTIMQRPEVFVWNAFLRHNIFSRRDQKICIGVRITDQTS